ncbi:MAG: c-type cytochrome [Deltaproteobacteria bacterium]|nr:c-type cytochrome [Deltaproteobacteria bacterium]
MADREDELLNHDYDGIQEYDNQLPKWWVYLFLCTIVFAVVYVGYYQFGPGLSQTEVLALEMAEMQKLAAVQAPAADSITEEMLLARASEPARLAAGQGIYAGKCLACHGPQGQGLVGPNLTDDHWIHGPLLTDMRRTVVEGVPAKGMLSWKALLSEEEIQNVVFYIHSLHGTNPPNPKQPEGTLAPAAS